MDGYPDAGYHYIVVSGFLPGCGKLPTTTICPWLDPFGAVLTDIFPLAYCRTPAANFVAPIWMFPFFGGVRLMHTLNFRRSRAHWQQW